MDNEKMEYYRWLMRIENHEFQTELLSIVSVPYTHSFLEIMNSKHRYFSYFIMCFSIKQGFKRFLFSPSEAAQIIAACEAHLDEKYTMDQIRGGILKEKLIEEDYLAPFKVILVSC